MGVVLLDDFPDSPVQRVAAILQDASVSYFMGQRVLECVFQFGKQLRFVNELGFFQAFQPKPKSRALPGVRSPASPLRYDLRATRCLGPGKSRRHCFQSQQERAVRDRRGLEFFPGFWYPCRDTRQGPSA